MKVDVRKYIDLDMHQDKMATERKKQKLDDEPTLFLQPDVILVVEGKQFHVRKQVLAENSPVFRRMFESKFKERHDVRISLPGKKYKEFEMFLRTFYHPSIVCPITSKLQLLLESGKVYIFGKSYCMGNSYLSSM